MRERRQPLQTNIIEEEIIQQPIENQIVQPQPVTPSNEVNNIGMQQPITFNQQIQQPQTMNINPEQPINVAQQQPVINSIPEISFKLSIKYLALLTLIFFKVFISKFKYSSYA